MKKLFLAMAIFLLGACAQLPEATGEVAQAVASSEVVTQASEVGKIVNQDINVPIWVVGIVALGFWCVSSVRQ